MRAYSLHKLVRDNIDVYENEKLYTLQNQIKEQCLYCCSTFHSHVTVVYSAMTITIAMGGCSIMIGS